MKKIKHVKQPTKLVADRKLAEVIGGQGTVIGPHGPGPGPGG